MRIIAGSYAMHFLFTSHSRGTCEAFPSLSRRGRQAGTQAASGRQAGRQAGTARQAESVSKENPPASPVETAVETAEQSCTNTFELGPTESQRAAATGRDSVAETRQRNAQPEAPSHGRMLQRAAGRSGQRARCRPGRRAGPAADAATLQRAAHLEPRH
jgi:hypothetical protein